MSTEDKQDINVMLGKISAIHKARAGIMEALDNDVQFYEKKIAALEKKASQPREFVISKTSLGKYQCAPADECIHMLIGDGTSPIITVREVKPIVVTGEIAKDIYYHRIDSTKPCDDSIESAIALYKTMGIDAEAG